MALVVEDGTAKANSNAYDTAANANAYYVDMGYVGSFATESPLVNGAVAAAATTMAIDGGSGTETVKKGDTFRVAGVVGVYEFTKDAVAVSGAIAVAEFTPAAPTGGFGNDAAITFLGDVADDGDMIRGSRALDERYRLMLKGAKTTSGQAMAWPRVGMSDEDGNVVASDTIPTPWKHAAYEMARLVSTKMAVGQTQRLRAVGAGSARVEFATAFTVGAAEEHVSRLVRQYTKAAGKRVRA